MSYYGPPDNRAPVPPERVVVDNVVKQDVRERPHAGAMPGGGFDGPAIGRSALQDQRRAMDGAIDVRRTLADQEARRRGSVHRAPDEVAMMTGLGDVIAAAAKVRALLGDRPLSEVIKSLRSKRARMSADARTATEFELRSMREKAGQVSADIAYLEDVGPAIERWEETFSKWSTAVGGTIGVAMQTELARGRQGVLEALAAYRERPS